MRPRGTRGRMLLGYALSSSTFPLLTVLLDREIHPGTMVPGVLIGESVSSAVRPTDRESLASLQLTLSLTTTHSR